MKIVTLSISHAEHGLITTVHPDLDHAHTRLREVFADRPGTGDVPAAELMTRLRHEGTLVAITDHEVPAIVLVVRHPDASNAFTLDGDIYAIDLDLDLGASFDRIPGDDGQALEFATTIKRLDAVPVGSPVFAAAADVFATVVETFPEAAGHVRDYVDARRGLRAGGYPAAEVD
jgi:hypothetical protein